MTKKVTLIITFNLILLGLWLVVYKNEEPKNEEPVNVGFEIQKVSAERVYIGEKELDIKNTDENEGEKFIIKTDRKDYNLWHNNAPVYFSVENTGAPEWGYIKFALEDDHKLKYIKKFNGNEDKTRQEPIIEKQEIACKNATTTTIKEYERVYDTEETSHLVETCFNKVKTGEKTINYKKAKYKYLTREKSVQLLGAITPKTVKGNTYDGQYKFYFPTGISHFKSEITFPENTESEFFIEVYGEDQGYGHLDPDITGQGGNDADTKLLLHMDGDRSTSHDTTVVSTPIWSTSTNATAFDGSIELDGSTDYLTAPDSTDWDIVGSNSQDYTIEFFVKHDTHAATEEYIGQSEDNNNRWAIQHLDVAGLRWLVRSGGATEIFLSSGSDISDSNWHHVALIKVTSGGPTVEYGLYLDGDQVGYISDAFTDSFAADLNIGRNLVGDTNYFDGNLDELRISNSNVFSASPNVGETDTITVPTSPYTADANTKYLNHFNGDVSAGATENYDVTFANTGIVMDQLANDTAFNQSLQFDGTTDYLTIPDSTDWDVVGDTSQDYTIDLWVKHDNHLGTEQYVAQYEDGSNRWFLKHENGTGISFDVASGGALVLELVGGEITDTNWHHVALVKKTSGGPTVEYGLYKDGTQVAYTSDTSSDTFTGDLTVGARTTPSDFFDGNLDEIRIQKSNAFNASPNVGETDTITVPTKPYDEGGATTTPSVLKKRGSILFFD